MTGLVPESQQCSVNQTEGPIIINTQRVQCCGGYVHGKLYNSDRQCFLCWEHKLVEFLTTLTTLLKRRVA